MLHRDVFSAAKHCLCTAEADEKCELTRSLAVAWRAGELGLACAEQPVAKVSPGRPPKPELVAPRDLPRRKLNSVEGRAALLHALTHIEFNAINLGLDAVYRFRDMPREFYGDWLRVAEEEACHFGLLRERLRELGYEYGDFPAHNSLWEMAEATAHDVMVRMALVPRVLEARGLDVTPGMMERLREAGDLQSVTVLEIILRDEVGHVDIGSRWFRHVCDERGLAPECTFLELIDHYMKGRIRGPFHTEARLAAGFSEAELEALLKL